MTFAEGLHFSAFHLHLICACLTEFEFTFSELLAFLRVLLFILGFYTRVLLGYNTPHSGVASGVMTPADLDLPLDLDGFEDFSAGDGFQGFPVASTSVTAANMASSHQQSQQQQYTPVPAQQVVNVQQGEQPFFLFSFILYLTAHFKI